MTSIEPTEFRAVMGQLPTGVTVVTSMDANDPLGLVIGSVVSVSLDPPLVAFFPGRASRAWQRMRTTDHVCINVLGVHQIETSGAFMRDPAHRFSDIDWIEDHNGVPRLAGSAATISARIISIQEAGDHDYVLCRVESMNHEDDVDPLVFHDGRYGTVARE